MWMCLSLSYFSTASADEMFATSSGKVHPAHCLTRRDVALFRGDNQLECLTGDRQIGQRYIFAASRETRSREGTFDCALEMTFTVRGRGTEPTAVQWL